MDDERKLKSESFEHRKRRILRKLLKNEYPVTPEEYYKAKDSAIGETKINGVIKQFTL